MLPDIVIVADGETYRLVHGYLHLASELDSADKIYVDVRNNGKVMIIKTRDGYFVSKGGRLYPLLRA